MKKILISLLACLVFCGVTVPCYAENVTNQPVATYTETVAEGVTCETTIYVDDVMTRASARGGSINKDYYYKGERIASVVLNVSFTYDGSSATATGTSSDHAVASGWSYSGESVWRSGATAYLTATISGPVTFPVSLSLTCSPTGVLS